MFVLVFFFFKQKTAYEMRISDWSSDVCSSDLPMSKRNYLLAGVAVIVLVLGVWWFAGSGTAPEPSLQPAEAGKAAPGILPVDRKQAARLGKIGRASCRERVCQYV